MIKIRTILEFIKYVWQSKTKQYLIVYLHSNKDKSGNTYKVEYCKDFKLAQKKAYDLLSSGETQSVKICMEISVVKAIVEIKK